MGRTTGDQRNHRGDDDDQRFGSAEKVGGGSRRRIGVGARLHRGRLVEARWEQSTTGQLVEARRRPVGRRLWRQRPGGGGGTM